MYQYVLITLRRIVGLCIIVLFSVGALGEQFLSGVLQSQAQEVYTEKFTVQAVEQNRSVASISPQQMIANRLRVVLENKKNVCKGIDLEREIDSFKDVQWDPSEESIRMLQAYCLVGGQTWKHNKTFDGDVSITVGEAIKVVTKILAMRDDVVFDEFGRYPGYLPYDDMLPNAWYASYVIYADMRGYLEGVVGNRLFGRGNLKALMPIKKSQLTRLFENAGKNMEDHPLMKASGTYITRNAFARLVTDAFADELGDYRALYGNNGLVFKRLVGRLSGKSQQQQQKFIQTVITTFEKLDPATMYTQYALDIQGIVDLLRDVAPVLP